MEYRRSIHIDAAPAAVWAVLADVERWPEWTPTMTSVQVQGGGSLELGSSARVKQPRFPTADWTVNRFQPGHAFDWVSTAPGTRSVGRHEVVAAADGGSTVNLSFAQTGALGGVLGRLWGRTIRRYVDTEAESLRRWVERGGPSA